MPQNNASRIHTILVDVKKHLGGVPTLVAWSKALNVKETLDEVAPLLVEMLRQLDDLESEIRDKFDVQKANVRLKYIPEIRKAIAFQDINVGGSNVNATLSREALYSLEFLIHELDEEPDLTPSDLNAINEALNGLFDTVDKSDINKRLRDWIMSMLSMIRRAVDRYRISGAKGLQDALIRIAGELALNQPALEKVEKESPTIFSKFIAMVSLVHKISEIVERCRKLGDSPLAGYLGAAGSGVLRALGFEFTPTDSPQR
jgi:hypothetical protein